MKLSLIQASLQLLHAIKMYTVVLQRSINSQTKVQIIKVQREQADILRPKLMIKKKETANSPSLDYSNEMMISIIIMLNYNRNKSVIITDRKELKIITISKK
jgi:hypothetical protein